MTGVVRRLGCATVWIAVAVLLVAVQPAAAQPAASGQRLDACSRGNVQVCFELLQRPRLDAGRRAAIEFHLAELEKAVLACTAGDATACATLANRYPDLPPDLRARAAPPKAP